MAKTFKTPEEKSRPTHEQIAKRAYEIFERNGRRPGQDLANWLAAESELINERGSTTTHAARINPERGNYRETITRQSS